METVDYYFYNTDAKSMGGKRRFPLLIQKRFAVTSGPRSFGEQLGRLGPGDTVLMYENQVGIVAVGTVLERWDGQSHTTPLYYLRDSSGFGHEYRIRVDWFLDVSDNPITLGELRRRIGAPRFTPRGAISRQVRWREEIKSLIDERRGTMPATLIEDLREIEKRKDKSTTKEALVNARIGQGTFRSQVLQLWENSCALTRSMTHDAIRASHIKPWRLSTDEERLDPNNGLPLVSSLDSLFDVGLISFDSSGRLIVSSKMNATERQIFCLHDESLTKTPVAKTAEYLAYHRDNVFRK
jgi:putative restriction endonuclease